MRLIPLKFVVNMDLFVFLLFVYCFIVLFCSLCNQSMFTCHVYFPDY